MRARYLASICVCLASWGAAPTFAQESLGEEEVRDIVRSVLAEETAEPEDDGDEWTIGTKNRLSLTSPDGRFEYRVGGRIHEHVTAWSADDEFEAAGAPLDDSAFLRRARLYATALLYGNVYAKIEYDFGSGSSSPADVYGEIRDLPGTNLRVGHFYEPFSLDSLTSSNDSTFVERSTAAGFLAPNRNMGIMLHERYCEERGTWAVGAFRTTDSSGSVESEGQPSYTARGTYLPIDEDEGKRLLHLGLAASCRNPDGNVIDYAAEPEAKKASDVLDTGVLAAERTQLYGAELGAVFGCLSGQGEYILVENQIDAGSDADFSSWYAQVSWMLTGEHRLYDREKGAFGSVKPKKNFGEKEGWGAFETALRWSATDFEDGMVDGGTMDQITIGANWYLNPNVRLMANVVLVDVESIAGTSGVDGNAEAFTMRFQVAF
jgi:phosphate-selective porin OprO/OprP